MMAELALVAWVVATVAWTLGNTGFARRAAPWMTFLFILFLVIAAILFGLALLGVSFGETPNARFRSAGPHPANTVRPTEDERGRNTIFHQWAFASAFVNDPVIEVRSTL